MILDVFLSVAIPGTIGFFIVSLFLPVSSRRLSGLIMKSFLSAGIGLGISSVLFFYWLLTLASIFSFTSFIVIELFVLTAVLASFIYVSRRKNFLEVFFDQSSDELPKNINIILILIFSSAFVSAFIAFTLMMLQGPHGGYDGYAIWNMRARFLFRGTEHWRETFSNLIDWTSHPDYPLLLPGIVARYWKYLGQDLKIVPGINALFFVLITIGLLVSSLSTLKSKGSGYVAGILLLGTNHFFLTAANQNADIPMSFYILATILLFFIFDKHNNQKYILFLAGITSGLVGWTKNEGLLFILALFIARFFVIVPSQGIKEFLRQVTAFALGFLPMAGAIAYFKVYIAPASDIISSKSLAAVQHNTLITNRFMAVIQKITIMVASYVPLIILVVYGLLVGIKKDSFFNRSVPMFIILNIILFVGYILIYTISPHDPNWHIKYSIGRLSLQVWPSILFIFFLITPSPEEIINKCYVFKGNELH